MKVCREVKPSVPEQPHDPIDYSVKLALGCTQQLCIPVLVKDVPALDTEQNAPCKWGPIDPVPLMNPCHLPGGSIPDNDTMLKEALKKNKTC